MKTQSRIPYFLLYSPCARVAGYFSGIFLLISCTSSSYEGPKSDHFDGQKFFNPEGDNKKSFSDVLRWQFFGDRKEWPESLVNIARPDLRKELDENSVAVTFVNHATMLLQFKGYNILTDPIWSERPSPFQWVGHKRVREPGIAWEDLPKIDAVIISHNHYDHMDEATLARLKERDQPLILIPLGDKAYLNSFGVDRIEEMDWWQERKINDELKIVFTPARHWSGRWLNDRYESLWGSYTIIYRGHHIYFGGDTGYGPHFKAIEERLGPMDLAFLPIGAYEPRWFMKDYHMNPAEAVLAHKDLGSKKSLGIHFGTFQLTDESIEQPLVDLHKAIESSSDVHYDDFSVLAEGQTLLHSFEGRESE